MRHHLLSLNILAIICTACAPVDREFDFEPARRQATPMISSSPPAALDAIVASYDCPSGFTASWIASDAWPNTVWSVDDYPVNYLLTQVWGDAFGGVGEADTMGQTHRLYCVGNDQIDTRCVTDSHCLKWEMPWSESVCVDYDGLCELQIPYTQ